jgi:hypothetical protein
MVPVFMPTQQTSTTMMTTADLEKDVYYKTTALPPLPILNGKEDCRGRLVMENRDKGSFISDALHISIFTWHVPLSHYPYPLRT